MTLYRHSRGNQSGPPPIRRRPGLVVWAAVLLCLVVCCGQTASTAFAAQPLRFDPPPVDTTSSRLDSAGSAQQQPAQRPSQPAASTAAQAPEQVADPASAQAPEQVAGQVPEPAAEGDAPSDGEAESAEASDAKPVHLFDTADMFRKSISGNAPQWERVVNDVKKKVYHSHQRV